MEEILHYRFGYDMTPFQNMGSLINEDVLETLVSN